MIRRRWRVPLPSRAHPRRGVRGPLVRRRRELHGRVADVIEQRHADRPEDAAELLSLHYFNAGRWHEAWTYSRLAGDSAREVYANVDAASFYERAIETSAASRTSGRRRRGEDVAVARRGTGSIGRLSRGDRRAQARRLLEDDPVAQAEIHEARALAWARLGSYSTALPRRDRARARRVVDGRCRGLRTTSSRYERRSTCSKGAS